VTNEYFSKKSFQIKFAYLEIWHIRKIHKIPINPAIFRRVICNRCYYEPRLTIVIPHADTFLSPLLSAPLFFLRLYIGDGYCHSKGGRNELPKYLRAAVARERNLYWRINLRQFLHILPSFFGKDFKSARDYDKFRGLRARFNRSQSLFRTHMYTCVHADLWNTLLDKNSLRTREERAAEAS